MVFIVKQILSEKRISPYISLWIQKGQQWFLRIYKYHIKCVTKAFIFLYIYRYIYILLMSYLFLYIYVFLDQSCKPFKCIYPC